MTGNLSLSWIDVPTATGIADPPPAANFRLEISAFPDGTPIAAASTVGTLENASHLKRSINAQMFLTELGLRHPAGDSTTRQPPALRVAKVCVSEPPTWNSGMPNSRLPGLARRSRLTPHA